MRNLRGELYRNLLQLDSDRKILLFEKNRSYAGGERAAARTLNLARYGRAEGTVAEDIICAVRTENGGDKLLWWQIRLLYERFKREGWTGILPELLLKLQCAEGEGAAKGREAYGQNCDSLIVRPLNYQRNEKELKNGIYRLYGDIALVIGEVLEEEMGEMSVRIMRRENASCWNVGEENLFANALLNTCRKMPPILFCTCGRGAYAMQYVLTEESFVRTKQSQGQKNKGGCGLRAEKMIAGCCLTTQTRINGAAAVFYPGVRTALTKLLGTDFLFGFAGADEVLLHPINNADIHELREHIRQANAACPEKNVLSRKLYRYSSKRADFTEA